LAKFEFKEKTKTTVGNVRVQIDKLEKAKYRNYIEKPGYKKHKNGLSTICPQPETKLQLTSIYLP